MRVERPSWLAKRRKWLIPALIIDAAIIVVIAVVWVLHATPSQAQAKAPRAGAGGMPVVAAPAAKSDIEVSLDALGTVTPLATVTIKPQVSGQLMQLAFQEGQLVQKNDFLAQIDPRPFQAALMQAEGQLARDQAQLEEARIDLKRYETLVAQDSIAQQQYDAQKATVHQDEGIVKTDQAAIDTAKLNLAYSHIVAPLSGRVGLRQVDPGNYVQTSDPNGVVVITQIDPISVIFTLPEDNVQKVLQRMQSGAILQVTAFDRSGATRLATGKLLTIDNQIDPTTGTVKLRALFDNKELSLFPNQFVNVRLLIDQLHDATVVPSSAILRGAPGTYVYVVNADKTVAVRPVTLGPAQGDRQSVTAGLEPGDVVVTDGSDRLREGAKVSLPGSDEAAAGAAAGAAGGKEHGDGKEKKKHKHKDGEAPAP